jgi:hypothetical protein
MNVTTSFTPINSPTDGRNSRMESRVHGNVHARFGGGDTPYPKGSTVPTLRSISSTAEKSKDSQLGQCGIVIPLSTGLWHRLRRIS